MGIKAIRRKLRKKLLAFDEKLKKNTSIKLEDELSDSTDCMFNENRITVSFTGQDGSKIIILNELETIMS